MDSDPRRKRRRIKHRRYKPGSSRSSVSGKSSHSSKRSKVKPSTSFTKVAPSSASILIEQKKDPPRFRAYALGLAGVLILVLLGGGHNVYALSLSLILPGLALFLRPPTRSPGVWLDRSALAFLVILLLAFLPQFYWPDPDWRVSAEEVLGIGLPPTLSIQPWSSLEAWICALAGFGWFYAACSWRINNPGRMWFFFLLCMAVAVLAAVVLWGNIKGVKYPSAEDSTHFSFFPNRNQTANLLAVGGLAAFGYAMCILRTRLLLPLIGFIAAMMTFLALVWGVSRAGVLLLLAGAVVWYFLQIFSGRMPKAARLGLPLLLVAFSVFIVSNSRVTERVMSFVASPEEWSNEFRSQIAMDCYHMICDAPLSGHGLGTFAAIFPQYREHSANYQRALHPESDLLWLAAESGVLGLLLLLAFIIAYFFRCRGLSRGKSGLYRLAALAPLLIFLMHSLVDVSGHRPGTMYFAILLAALALPKAKKDIPTLSPRTWRCIGGILMFFGILWAISGLTRLPLHSSVALANHEADIREGIEARDYNHGLESATAWVGQRPLDWRGYFQRATLTLADSGSRADAAADFRRARFAEPDLGIVAFEEGLVWIQYDINRALGAWREVLFRNFDSREHVFRQMLREADRYPELKLGLARLSDLDTRFRVKFLVSQSGETFMREIRRDLDENEHLGQFSRQDRSSILLNWIFRGDRESAEAFLGENEKHLNRPWWLWSQLRKEQAKFEEAVKYIRSAIEAPALPKLPMDGVPLERLKREFSLTPGDIMKGTALLHVYIGQKDYQSIQDITTAMISDQKDAPHYVRYWNAESYFLLNDYIESWFAYERYLKRVWDDD